LPGPAQARSALRVRDIEVTILALVFIVAHVVVYIIH